MSRSPCFDWRRIQRVRLMRSILLTFSRSPCFIPTYACAPVRDGRSRVEKDSKVDFALRYFYGLPVVVLVLSGEGFKEVHEVFEPRQEGES